MEKLDIEGLNKHREQTVTDILELLKDNNRVGCVRYTGYGKSYFVVRRLIEELNEKVLIVVPNSYLYRQYDDMYKNMDNVEVLTYQTLKNIKDEKLNEWKDFKYIIADECHHLLAPKWGEEFIRIENLLQCKVVGLTATPIRGDGKNVIKEYFRNIQVEPLELLDGIALNYVSKLKYVVAYAEIDTKYDNKLSDIDRYAIKNLINVESILKKYIPKKKLKHNLKLPVYVPKVEYIQETKQQCYKWFSKIYPEKNINIYSIHSRNSSQYVTDTLNRFKENNNDTDIDIMVSVDMLKEGLHLPTMGVEIMLRKTKSPITYLQQIGRVVNDEQPIVFDLINNQKHVNIIKTKYKNYSPRLNVSDKITFDNCIKLIDTTTDITKILTKYIQGNDIEWNRIEDIIQSNLKFIVDNCHAYTYESMGRLLGISAMSLKRHLMTDAYKSFNLQFNYRNGYRTYEDINKIILQNREYIESNPDNLTFGQMADKLDIGEGLLRTTCKRCGVDYKSWSRATLIDKYNDTLTQNREYIESNPDNLSVSQMSKKFDIPRTVFVRRCEILQITTKFQINEHERIVLCNKEYIESNPDNLGQSDMAQQLNINVGMLVRFCKKHNIDIRTNYVGSSKNKRIKCNNVKSCKEYIESNPDNLTKKSMANKFKYDAQTFRKICKSLDIDLTTNYPTSKYNKY